MELKKKIMEALELVDNVGSIIISDKNEIAIIESQTTLVEGEGGKFFKVDTRLLEDLVYYHFPETERENISGYKIEAQFDEFEYYRGINTGDVYLYVVATHTETGEIVTFNIRLGLFYALEPEVDRNYSYRKEDIEYGYQFW